MLFSGYTISDIAFTALIPLCILLAFTIIMMLANAERDEEDKYIMWEKIQMVVGIFFFSGCNIPDSFVSLLAGAFLSILKRNNGGYISCLVDIQLLK